MDDNKNRQPNAQKAKTRKGNRGKFERKNEASKE